MIEQQGRVVKLDGKQASVEIGVSLGCTACDQGKGCGAGLFVQLLRRKQALVQVDNGINASLGQAVLLQLSEYVFLRLLLKLYLLPLLSGLAGAGLGHYIANVLEFSPGWIDALSLLGATIFMASALLFNRASQPKLVGQAGIGMAPMNKGPGTEFACLSD